MYRNILIGMLTLILCSAVFLESPRVISAQTNTVSKKIFAYYYVWWSNRHWHDKLGTSYPYTATPLPLPATIDSSECTMTNLYSGNQLTDITNPTIWDQDVPGVIETDVRNAVAAGLTGFLVSWKGNGSATQSVSDVSYSRRLDAMFQAVNKVNAEGHPFKLWISLKISDTIYPAENIKGDLAYLKRQYGNNPALDMSFGKPVVVWTGSRKYDLATIASVSTAFRSSFFLLADENYRTWNLDARPQYFDGSTYYWSTQDPYGNPASFDQIRQMAAKVRSTRNPDGSNKVWIAPFTPGYNDKLLNSPGTCIPRGNGQTMNDLFNGNATSNPEAWTFISWNEIAEGSYILPMTRYGRQYIDLMATLTGGPAAITTQGDANGDAIVDGRDYIIWALNVGTNTSSGVSVGDFDRSGVVNDSDYQIWIREYTNSL